MPTATKEKKNEDVKDRMMHGKEVLDPPADWDFESIRVGAIECLAHRATDIFCRIIRVLEMTPMTDPACPDYVREGCKTACIARAGSEARIFYDPSFVYTFANDPISFACLLAHEICHHALGHLRRTFKGPHGAVNFAQDAIINSLLYNLNRRSWSKAFAFHFTRFLEEFYPLESEEEPEIAMLRPPSFDWQEARKELREMEARDPDLAEMWRALYWDHKVTETDVLEWLFRRRPELEQQFTMIVVLLGSQPNGQGSGLPGEQPGQGEPQEGEEEGIDFGVIMAQVEEKEAEEEEAAGEPVERPGISKQEAAEVLMACNGEGKGGPMVDHYLKTLAVCIPDPEAEEALRRNSLFALQHRLVNDMLARVPEKLYSVVPKDLSNRSDLLRVMSGNPPFKYRIKKKRPAKPAAKAYLDTSGSMDSYLEWEAGVCIAFNERVDLIPACFADFSCGVKETTMEALKNHRIWKGGGTDINCVLRDILARGDDLLCSVVFSDGCFSPDKKLCEAIRARGLKVFGILFLSGDDDANVEESGYFQNFAMFATATYPITESKTRVGTRD